MQQRSSGLPTSQEACDLIASYLLQRPSETVEISGIAHLTGLPEETIAQDLRSLRESKPKRRFVDRSGLLSAAIAFVLIASGLAVHTVRGHSAHVEPPLRIASTLKID